MAQALQHGERQGTKGASFDAAIAGRHGQQLGLYEELGLAPATSRPARFTAGNPPLCAGCRAREARYGFRPEGVEAPAFDRPRALCFDCFRAELTRRQMVRERMARGWNAHQVGLPLDRTLRALDKRRRRAQIAARHALEA